MEIEKSPAFKEALKMVLKRQLNTLLSQFKEAGEEIAVMAASVEDRTCSHFGSPTGEEFMTERNNLANNFLDYCLKKKDDDEKAVVITLKRDEIAGLTAEKLKKLMQNVYGKVKGGSLNVSASANSPKKTNSPEKTNSKTNSSEKTNSKTNKDKPAAVTPVRQTRSGRIINSPKKMQSSVSGKRSKSPSVSQSKISIMDSLELTPTISSEQPVLECIDDEVASDMEMFEENLDDDVGDPDFKPKIKDKAPIFDGVDNLRPDDGNASNKKAQMKATMIKKEAGKVRQRVLNRERIKKLQKVPCHICGISLKGHWSLVAHVKRVHEKVINKHCPVCPKGFYTLTALSDHKLAVHTRKCPSCNGYLVEDTPWQEGMTLSTERKVLCGCGEMVIFQTRRGAPRTNFSEKKRKRNPDDKTSNYACGVCGKLFQSKKHCEKHASMHGTTKPYICEVCGLSFKHDHTLKNHLNNVHGISAIACKYCGKNFCGEISMKVHISKYHGEEHSRSTSYSEENTETADTTMMLVESSNMMLGEQEEDITNQESPANIEIGTDDCENATNHEVVETDLSNENPSPIKTVKHCFPAGSQKKGKLFKPMLPCKYCGIHIKGKHGMTNHVRRVHEKVKNSYCPVCFKGFWCRANADEHKLSVHTRQCSACKTYVVEQDPWSEGMAMEIERSVLCNCGNVVSIVSKRGIKKSEMPKLRRKNVKKSYICDVCDKRFTVKKLLEAHAKTHEDPSDTEQPSSLSEMF